MPEVIRLHARERVGARSCPAIGGAIAAFTLARRDVLRPTPDDARTAADVRRSRAIRWSRTRTGSRSARLTFGERDHVLARNFGDAPHAIHGVGWQRAWSIVEATASDAQIALSHDAGGVGAAVVAVAVPRDADVRARHARRHGALLTMRLALGNAGTHPFPFGLGWHPFFPKTVDTTLGFASSGVWENDATQLPVARVDVPARWRFDPPRALDALALDHVFESARGTATIAGPRVAARPRSRPTARSTDAWSTCRRAAISWPSSR